MTGEDLTIGAFGISVVLSVILRVIYNAVEVPNKLKPIIAILLGMALGIVSLLYVGEVATFSSTVDYMLRGFMTGAAAVGFYEITQKKEVTK